MDVPTYTVIKQDFENSVKIEGTVEPVNTVIVACPPNIEGVINNLIEDGTYVEEGDILGVVEVQSLDTEYEELLTRVETLQAALEKTKADLQLQYAVLDAQVKNNEAETDIALLDSVALRFATPTQKRINELELKKVMIEREKLKKKLDALAIVNQSEVRKLELQIQRVSNNAKDVKERIDALTLRAPKNGLAMRAVRGAYASDQTKIQIGDPVWHLMPIITIPDREVMKIKLRIPEVDFKLINENDSVVYTFDAMPDNRGWGKIKVKSPVGQQYKQDSRVKFFDVEASLDSVLVVPDPGLTANCKVVLTHISDTIVVPQIAVNEVDSMKVVYVKTSKGYEMRQVETGIYSQKEIIISAGLKRGEIVALIPPHSDQIKSKTTISNSSINIRK